MLIVGPGIMAQQHIPSRQARCSHYDQQAEHPTPLSTLQQLQPQSTISSESWYLESHI